MLILIGHLIAGTVPLVLGAIATIFGGLLGGRPESLIIGAFLLLAGVSTVGLGFLWRHVFG
ncbi:MAG: hypothetical protein FWD06_06975 [Oscillospiraceae bacterium]|nr:hypothetical protein [Oscillospiraceae bacterium]